MRALLLAAMFLACRSGLNDVLPEQVAPAVTLVLTNDTRDDAVLRIFRDRALVRTVRYVTAYGSRTIGVAMPNPSMLQLTVVFFGSSERPRFLDPIVVGPGDCLVIGLPPVRDLVTVLPC